jgi:hypothetical protein
MTPAKGTRQADQPLRSEDIAKALETVKKWQEDHGYDKIQLTQEQLAALHELPKTLPKGATITINGETHKVVTTPLATKWTVACPNHPHYDKEFDNKVYASQELARHQAEAMPKGREPRLRPTGQLTR